MPIRLLAEEGVPSTYDDLLAGEGVPSTDDPTYGQQRAMQQQHQQQLMYGQPKDVFEVADGGSHVVLTSSGLPPGVVSASLSRPARASGQPVVPQGIIYGGDVGQGQYYGAGAAHHGISHYIPIVDSEDSTLLYGGYSTSQIFNAGAGAGGAGGAGAANYDKMSMQQPSAAGVAGARSGGTNSARPTSARPQRPMSAKLQRPMSAPMHQQALERPASAFVNVNNGLSGGWSQQVQVQPGQAENVIIHAGGDPRGQLFEGQH